MTVLIHTDHPKVRTGVAEQPAKSEAGRTVKRVANIDGRETGSKIDRDSGLLILRTVARFSPARKRRPTSLFTDQCWPPAPPVPSPTCWAALGYQNAPKHPHVARRGICGPAAPPLRSPFRLPEATLGYCNVTVLIHTDHPKVRTGVAEQSAKSEAGRAVKRVANIARAETGSKIVRDSGRLILRVRVRG